MCFRAWLLLFPLLISFAINAQADITTGLVGYWKFDEANGATTFVDSTVNGDSGTANGAVSAGVAGKINKAASISAASSQYISFPSNAVYTFTTSFSVALWYKASAWGTGSGWCGIVGTASNYSNGWDLRQYNTGNFIEFSMQSTSAGDVSGSVNVEDGNWHFIVAVVDTTGKTVAIYVDNVKDNSASYTYTGTITQQTHNIAIGYEPQYNRYTSLTIDELRLYNRTLSTADISQLYSYTGLTKPNFLFHQAKLNKMTMNLR